MGSATGRRKAAAREVEAATRGLRGLWQTVKHTPGPKRDRVRALLKRLGKAAAELSDGGAKAAARGGYVAEAFAVVAEAGALCGHEDHARAARRERRARPRLGERVTPEEAAAREENRTRPRPVREIKTADTVRGEILRLAEQAGREQFKRRAAAVGAERERAERRDRPNTGRPRAAKPPGRGPAGRRCRVTLEIEIGGTYWARADGDSFPPVLVNVTHRLPGRPKTPKQYMARIDGRPLPARLRARDFVACGNVPAAEVGGRA